MCAKKHFIKKEYYEVDCQDEWETLDEVLEVVKEDYDGNRVYIYQLVAVVGHGKEDVPVTMIGDEQQNVKAKSKRKGVKNGK